MIIYCQLAYRCRLPQLALHRIFKKKSNKTELYENALKLWDWRYAMCSKRKRYWLRDSRLQFCFHIPAERGVSGDYVEKGKWWMETVCAWKYYVSLPFRPVSVWSVSVARCGRAEPNCLAKFLLLSATVFRSYGPSVGVVVVVVVVRNTVRHSYRLRTVWLRITKFHGHIHTDLPYIGTGYDVISYFRSEATAKNPSKMQRQMASIWIFRERFLRGSPHFTLWS